MLPIADSFANSFVDHSALSFRRPSRIRPDEYPHNQPHHNSEKADEKIRGGG